MELNGGGRTPGSRRSTEIEAVIPYHPKDRETIEWCIDGIRSHLGASRVTVVGSRSALKGIEGIGAVLLDEDEVAEGLRFSSYSGNRWGWYFQQILKFEISSRIRTDCYVVVDADTVFLNPVRFLDGDGKLCYATSPLFHDPYFEAFRKLLGFEADREYSFIVHHMAMSRNIVEELKGRIGECSNCHPWYLAVVNCMNAGLPFSEYETYGHFMKRAYPGEMNVRSLRWSDIRVLPTKSLLGRLSRHFDFCSFHQYYRTDGRGFFDPIVERVKLERRLLKKNLAGFFGAARS